MKHNDENIEIKFSQNCVGRINKKQITLVSKLFIKLANNIFLLFLIVVIMWLYYIYIFWNIVPMIQSSNVGLNYKFWEKDNLKDSNYCICIFYLIFFHYNFFWFIFSFIRTSSSSPGEVHLDYKKCYSLIPNDKLTDDIETLKKNVENHIKTQKIRENSKSKYSKYLDSSSKKIVLKSTSLTENYEKSSIDESIFDDKSLINVEENIKNIYEELRISTVKEPYTRRCRFCLLLKTERMHHCRSCKKCYLKADHHCYFINNCVGFNNYKFFFCFLFYSLILLSFMSLTMINGLKYFYIEYGIDSINFLIFSVTYALAIITLFSIFYFFSLHIYFISKNITTIEYLEKYKKNAKKIDENQYNLGVWNNFKSVLGNNMLLWIIPLNGDFKSLEGYEFKKKEK